MSFYSDIWELLDLGEFDICWDICLVGLRDGMGWDGSLVDTHTKPKRLVGSYMGRGERKMGR